MDFNPTYSKSARLKTRLGFTLVEFMVAMGVGCVLLTVIGALSLWSGKSFAAIANYTTLDYASRNALDRLTREIRQTDGLRSYTTNGTQRILRLINPTNQQNVDIVYDTAEKTLVLKKNDVPVTLLRDCNTLNFTLYTRNTISNSFNEYPFFTATDDPKMCKVIKINWICSRRLFPTELINSESVQTAKIVIRHTQ
jgi:prepilin-type N-terminal cleavage/methylation domain-containing protein